MGETDCESGEPDTPEWVATTVVSEEQVDDVPVYHVTVKVEVPPDQDADREIDWPTSMTGAEGVMTPAAKAALTVTVTALDVLIAPPLSDT